jgi:16S rRNA (guanine527-N7)-methyltransferase
MSDHRHPLSIDRVPDWGDRLRRGAAAMGTQLDGRAIDRFDAFARMLQSWGTRLNLSSRLDADELIPLHLLDSLALPAVLPIPAGDDLLDLGSGAGIPGIPLAIARLDLRITLLEPRARRAVFLREVAHRLQLQSVSVVQARAEEISADPAHAGRHDWVTSRAVAPIPEVVAMTAPLVPPGGRLVIFLGPDEEPAGNPHFSLEAIRVTPVPGKAAPRSLAIFCRTERLHNG